ncbi:ImmA/IrrE family metallo-endopeptidase [Actinoplanes sp. CA-030573]|uniref:ImmA/IrrE family metallo-endopeptidase n=1 Tax=Actinoplanes sp. CA-030573 TaxID=3239898 RepID=UPI003D8D6177
MSSEAEGRAAADQFRNEHRLGRQPLGDLVALIEQATGIDVSVLDAGPDEHGLTMRDPTRGTVFIGVARTRRPMRQRSTLAHELAHALFEDWTDTSPPGSTVRPPAEVRADAFARHLLVPLLGLRDFLGAARDADLATLSAVVQYFLVSPAIAVIAMEQAGYIDAATKQSWMSTTTPQLAVRYGWSDQYHALQADADQRRAPQRLLTRAIHAYTEGLLAPQAIATLRGVPVTTLEQELSEAGIVPAEDAVAWTPVADLPDADVDLDALDADLGGPGDDHESSWGPYTS